MQLAMKNIYHDRKHLALSLADLDSMYVAARRDADIVIAHGGCSVKAMGSFLTGAVAIVALFLLNIIFSSGDFADVSPKSLPLVC